MITTTLRKILEHEPCGQDGDERGWGKLLKFLGKTKPDDEPLPLPVILESNGIADAVWALTAVDGRYDDAVRLFNCWGVTEGGGKAA